MTKQCNQCGRDLDISAFRAYPERTDKTRASASDGYHLLCRECEAFNAKATYLWKKSIRTIEEQDFVDRARDAYILLDSLGFRPRGSYAAHVLGYPPRARSATESYFDIVMKGEK